MTEAAIAWILAGAFAGGFVNGLTGFGTGLTALVFWLQAVPAATAAPLVSGCSVASQLLSLPAIWHALSWRRVLPLVLGALPGIPVGVLLLDALSSQSIRLGLGVLMVVYSAALLWLGGAAPTLRRSIAGDVAVGLASGVLGGLAGLSGVLPTIWSRFQGWSKDERRGVLQGFNLTVLALSAGVQAASGLVTRDVLLLFVLALPATLAASWLGQRAYRALSASAFDRTVLVVLLVAGLMQIGAILLGVA